MRLDAGEAAGEAGAAGAPVLPRLLPALLARRPLLPAAAAGARAGVGRRLLRGRRLLPIVIHSGGGSKGAARVLVGAVRRGGEVLGFNGRFISHLSGRLDASVSNWNYLGEREADRFQTSSLVSFEAIWSEASLWILDLGFGFDAYETTAAAAD